MINNQGDGYRAGWELTFRDEFDAFELDTTKWRPSYRFGPYHALDEDNCATPDGFDFRNGIISLLVFPKRDSCFYWSDKGAEYYPTNYMAGVLCSSETFEQTFGYFEIRCKIPAGQGIGSAFWLASNESWPPEIDVFEFQGQNPGKLYIGHSKEKDDGGFRKHFHFTDLSADFHTYAVEWTPDRLTYFIDENRLMSTRRLVPDKPMHIIASLTVGGGVEGCGFFGCPDETTQFPARFEIDHIRVYSRKPK